MAAMAEHRGERGERGNKGEGGGEGMVIQKIILKRKITTTTEDRGLSKKGGSPPASGPVSGERRRMEDAVEKAKRLLAASKDCLEISLSPKTEGKKKSVPLRTSDFKRPSLRQKIVSSDKSNGTLNNIQISGDNDLNFSSVKVTSEKFSSEKLSWENFSTENFSSEKVSSEKISSGKVLSEKFDECGDLRMEECTEFEEKTHVNSDKETKKASLYPFRRGRSWRDMDGEVAEMDVLDSQTDKENWKEDRETEFHCGEGREEGISGRDQWEERTGGEREGEGESGKVLSQRLGSSRSRGEVDEMRRAEREEEGEKGEGEWGGVRGDVEMEGKGREGGGRGTEIGGSGGETAIVSMETGNGYERRETEGNNYMGRRQKRGRGERQEGHEADWNGEGGRERKRRRNVGRERGRDGRRGSGVSLGSGPPDVSVFVGDLDPSTTDTELVTAFKEFGEVTKAVIIEFQCYGFVTFLKKEDMEAAIVAAERGREMSIRGKKIRVSRARGQLPDWQKGVGGFHLQKTGNRKGMQKVSAAEKTRAAAMAAAKTASQVFAGNERELLLTDPIKDCFPMPGRRVVAYNDLF